MKFIVILPVSLYHFSHQFTQREPLFNKVAAEGGHWCFGLSVLSPQQATIATVLGNILRILVPSRVESPDISHGTRDGLIHTGAYVVTMNSASSLPLNTSSNHEREQEPGSAGC